MTIPIKPARRAARRLALSVLAGGLASLLAAPLRAQDAPLPPGKTPSFADWRKRMLAAPYPHADCFKAEYPDASWQPVKCGPAPKDRVGRPPSKRGVSRTATVGSDTDYVVQVGTGDQITQALGFFPSVSGAEKETDDGNSLHCGGGRDDFSLQLNSNKFPLTASGEVGDAALGPGIQGWAQFVFQDATNTDSLDPFACHHSDVFIEYYLLDYAAMHHGNCPTAPSAGFGGNNWRSDDDGNCYINTPSHSVPNQHITGLSRLSLQGYAGGGADSIDVVTLTIDGVGMYSSQGPDDTVFLSRFWNLSEFNVFGEGGYSKASFNGGTTITVQNQVVFAGAPFPLAAADQCLNTNQGTTGEENNLALGWCCAITPPSSVGILFDESDAGAGNSPCACPSGSTWNPSTASCVCDVSGESLVNGQCQCAVSGQTPAGGSCQCPGDQVVKNDACACPAQGETLVGTACMCPSGQAVQNGACAACPSGQAVLNGACAACPTAAAALGATCASTIPGCPNAACATAGASCGSWDGNQCCLGPGAPGTSCASGSDGCGGARQCLNAAGHSIPCYQNVCCQPLVLSPGASCGPSFSDGCGGVAQCGYGSCLSAGFCQLSPTERCGGNTVPLGCCLSGDVDTTNPRCAPTPPPNPGQPQLPYPAGNQGPSPAPSPNQSQRP
jgi:hypothetical protein